MTRHEKFLNLATEIASNSTVTKSRHAALITKGKYIVAIGINSKTTHPVMFYKGGSKKIHLHAEIDALNNVKYKDVSGCVMYIARHAAKGHNFSRPCKICLQAIIERGIKKIIYTSDTGYITEHLLRQEKKNFLYG